MIIYCIIEHVNEYNDNIVNVWCVHADPDSHIRYGLVDWNTANTYVSYLHPISDAYNFLGISIVGHANDDGVGGIYVGTVMKG